MNAFTTEVSADLRKDIARIRETVERHKELSEQEHLSACRLRLEARNEELDLAIDGNTECYGSPALDRLPLSCGCVATRTPKHCETEWALEKCDACRDAELDIQEAA